MNANELHGCWCLSGYTGITIAIEGKSDREEVALYNGMTPFYIKKDDISLYDQRFPLLLFGERVKETEWVSEVCDRYPSSRIFVCPMVDGLEKEGARMRFFGEKPHRHFPTSTFTDVVSEKTTKILEYDPKLVDDAYGKMADCVASGCSVLNQIAKPHYESAFFGKVLSCNKGDVFIVGIGDVDRYFPTTPISAKLYAATSVPVLMSASDEFRKQVDVPWQFVKVFVATDYIPEVLTFMRFYKLFSRRNVVRSSYNTPYDWVFRTNKAYGVRSL